MAVDEVEVAKPRKPQREMSDAELQQDNISRMRAYFETREKVEIKTREDERVQINDYVFMIKGGEKVKVPVDVRDLLEESGRI